MKKSDLSRLIWDFYKNPSKSTFFFFKFGEKGKTGRDMHENNHKNKQFKFSLARRKYWTKITLFIEHYKPQ